MSVVLLYHFRRFSPKNRVFAEKSLFPERRQHIFAENLIEILLRHPGDDLAVDRDADARRRAFSKTERSAERHLVFKPVLGNGLPHFLDDFTGALEVTGAADTDLDDYHTFAKTSFSKNSCTVSGVTE